MKFINEECDKNKMGIYVITNIVNNKIYIGQTKESFHRRYWHHRWCLNQGTHCNQYLQNSWNKYGEDNFTFSMLEEVLDVNQLNEREIYWIEYYRNNSEVYNIQDGGQNINSPIVSQEKRKEIGRKNRERLLGTKLSEETKEKMRKAHKGKGGYHYNNTLSDNQVIEIKEMLMDNIHTKEISDITNVPYKFINNILSLNAYSYVIVDGWEDFLKRHNQAKIDKKEKTEKLHQEILRLYSEGYNKNQIAHKLNVSWHSVDYHL